MGIAQQGRIVGIPVKNEWTSKTEKSLSSIFGFRSPDYYTSHFLTIHILRKLTCGTLSMLKILRNRLSQYLQIISQSLFHRLWNRNLSTETSNLPFLEQHRKHVTKHLDERNSCLLFAESVETKDAA